MSLIPKYQNHKILFNLKETEVMNSFKQLLLGVERFGPSVKLECSNAVKITENETTELESARYTIMTRHVLPSFLPKAFSFIEKYTEIPKEIKELCISEAEIGRTHRDSDFLVGFEQKEDVTRFKLYLRVNHYNNLPDSIKSYFQEPLSQTEILVNHFFSKRNFGLGFDLIWDNKTKPTIPDEVVTKFYFSHNKNEYLNYEKAYEKFLSEKTKSIIYNSDIVFFSFRNNSENIHITFRTPTIENLFPFLPSSEKYLIEINDKYNLINQRIEQIGFLENQIKEDDIKNFNTYYQAPALYQTTNSIIEEKQLEFPF